MKHKKLHPTSFIPNAKLKAALQRDKAMTGRSIRFLVTTILEDYYFRRKKK